MAVEEEAPPLLTCISLLSHCIVQYNLHWTVQCSTVQYIGTISPGCIPVAACPQFSSRGGITALAGRRDINYITNPAPSLVAMRPKLQ